MLYTIAQVSDLTKLSKVSIYKKLKLKELQGHIFKKQGITYIDDIALVKIKNGLNLKEEVKSLKEEVKTDLKQDNTEQPVNEKISAIEADLTIYLKEQIKLKDEQVKLKDERIKDLENNLIELTKELNNRLAAQQELMKNMQILQLKQPQVQEISAQEVAAEQQDHEKQREQMQQEKPGIFKRFFSKK